MNHFDWNTHHQYQSHYGQYSRGHWMGGQSGANAHLPYPYSSTYKKTPGGNLSSFTSFRSNDARTQVGVSPSPLPTPRRTVKSHAQHHPTRGEVQTEEETAENLISSSPSVPSCGSGGESRPSVSSDVLDEMEFILSGGIAAASSTSSSQGTPRQFQHSSYHTVAPAYNKYSYTQCTNSQWTHSNNNYYSPHVRSSNVPYNPEPDTNQQKPKDDLTEIVNQVLNSVEERVPATNSRNDTSPKQEDPPKEPPTSSGNLCHNCGSIVSDVLTNCQQCGESLEVEDLSNSQSKPRRPRNIGIVEPRVVVKASPGPRKDHLPSKRRHLDSTSSIEEDKKIPPLRLSRSVKRKRGSLGEAACIAFQPTAARSVLVCSMEGCAFTTNQADKMSRHAADVHHYPSSSCGSERNTFQCHECGAKFGSMARMLKHDRKVHSGVKDYECRLCEAEITDIVEHSKVHKLGKSIHCVDCDLAFRHRSSYVRHLTLHHKPKEEKICITIPEPDKPVNIKLVNKSTTLPSVDKSPPECKPLCSPASSEGPYKLDYSSPLPSDSGISSDFNSPLHAEPNSTNSPSKTFEGNDLPNILTQSLFESSSNSPEVSPQIPFEFNVDLFNDETPLDGSSSGASKENKKDSGGEVFDKDESVKNQEVSKSDSTEEISKNGSFKGNQKEVEMPLTKEVSDICSSKKNMDDSECPSTEEISDNSLSKIIKEDFKIPLSQEVSDIGSSKKNTDDYKCPSTEEVSDNSLFKRIKEDFKIPLSEEVSDIGSSKKNKEDFKIPLLEEVSDIGSSKKNMDDSECSSTEEVSDNSLSEMIKEDFKRPLPEVSDIGSSKKKKDNSEYRSTEETSKNCSYKLNKRKSEILSTEYTSNNDLSISKSKDSSTDRSLPSEEAVDSESHNEIEIEKIQEAFQKELEEIDSSCPKENGTDDSKENHISPPQEEEQKGIAKTSEEEFIQPVSKANNEEKDAVGKRTYSKERRSPIIPPALKRKIIHEEYFKRVMNMLQDIEVSTKQRQCIRRESIETPKWKRRRVSLKELEDNLKDKVQAFINQLKCIREDRTKKEENFTCNKCGRVYKFENFFKVHKRRCE